MRDISSTPHYIFDFDTDFTYNTFYDISMASSTIKVSEEEIGKWTQYDTVDCDGNITYEVYRGLITGKFCNIKISYFYEDDWYLMDCIYGCIDIPEYDIEYARELTLDEERHCWTLDWDFNLNDEDEIPDNINEVFMKIYISIE